jgi:RNA polymerase sigma-70 factor, ECF subfamily
MINMEQLKDLPDNELLERLRLGDTAAFGCLYDRYFDPLYKYIFFRVSSKAEAEDLTEEVFLKTWEALHVPRAPMINFRAWLYRVAHNIVVDHYRASKKTDPLHQSSSFRETGESMEKIVEKKQTAEEIARAVAQLEPRFQQVITCRFISGLSHAETAEIMGLNINNLRVLQYRALRKLNSLLNKGDLSK